MEGLITGQELTSSGNVERARLLSTSCQAQSRSIRLVRSFISTGLLRGEDWQCEGLQELAEKSADFQSVKAESAWKVDETVGFVISCCVAIWRSVASPCTFQNPPPLHESHLQRYKGTRDHHCIL